MRCRAASAILVRSPIDMPAVWSITSSPMSGSVCRVSSTSRGPVSQPSSTANAASRHSVPGARRAAATASTARHSSPIATSSHTGTAGSNRSAAMACSMCI